MKAARAGCVMRVVVRLVTKAHALTVIMVGVARVMKVCVGHVMRARVLIVTMAHVHPAMKVPVLVATKVLVFS
jgi:hypothetical protein